MHARQASDDRPTQRYFCIELCFKDRTPCLHEYLNLGHAILNQLFSTPQSGHGTWIETNDSVFLCLDPGCTSKFPVWFEQFLSSNLLCKKKSLACLIKFAKCVQQFVIYLRKSSKLLTFLKFSDKKKPVHSLSSTAFYIWRFLSTFQQIYRLWRTPFARLKKVLLLRNWK